MDSEAYKDGWTAALFEPRDGYRDGDPPIARLDRILKHGAVTGDDSAYAAGYMAGKSIRKFFGSPIEPES